MYNLYMNEEINISSNIEIEKALKEFEVKSSTEEAQSNSEVAQTPDIPKMVGWVMKLSGGAIKEQRQAEYMLLGLVVLMFAVSFYFFFGGGDKNTKNISEPFFNQPQFLPQ